MLETNQVYFKNNMTDQKEKDDFEKLTKELEECKKQRDEYLAGWQRAKADFANYQKDEVKRIELMAKFAAADLILDILLVMDSFDLALVRARNDKDDEFSKGLHLIRAQLESILKKRGVEEIKALGEKLDTNFHEAVETTVDETKPEGTIVEVLERGYLLHGRVLRPAKVRVVTK